MSDRVVTIPAGEVQVGDHIWIEAGWRAVTGKTFGWTPPEYGAGTIAPPTHEDSIRTVCLQADGNSAQLVLDPARTVRLNLAHLHRTDDR